MDATTTPKTVKAAISVRQLSFDIDNSANEVQILLGAIFEKMDTLGENLSAMGPTQGTVLEAIRAVNCFASCALRGVSDILEQNERVLTATCEVPA